MLASPTWILKNELGDAAPTPEAASPRFAVAETATVWASVSEADAHPFLNSEQRAARPLQHSAPSVSVQRTHVRSCTSRRGRVAAKGFEAAEFQVVTFSYRTGLRSDRSHVQVLQLCHLSGVVQGSRRYTVQFCWIIGSDVRAGRFAGHLQETNLILQVRLKNLTDERPRGLTPSVRETLRARSISAWI